MKREKVKSSNIATIGFDPKEHILEVEFTTGDVYQYENVSRMEYMDLLEAKSIGSFFAKNIKYKYQYKKM